MAIFSFNLADVNGNNGFVINGAFPSFTFFNRTDFNGDGIEDLIVSGILDSETFSSNEIYLIYGRDNEPFPASFNLADIDGTNGIRITNEAEANALILVGGSVNINGDEISDLSLEFSVDLSQPESPDDFNQNTPHYIIFGDRDLPANLNVSDLDGNNGFSITSDEFDVSGAGGIFPADVNNDGINDLFLDSSSPLDIPDFSEVDPDDFDFDDIPDFTTPEPGPNYVIFGREGGFPANFNVDTLDGTEGFTIINSSASGDSSSLLIDGLEDINADGIDDIVLNDIVLNNIVTNNSSPSTPINYIVFGNENFPDTIDLATLDGNNGLTITGLTTDEVITESDFSVGFYNDLNGDDFNEIIISESVTEVIQPGDTSDQEETRTTDTFHFIFGRRDLPANIDLSTLELSEDEGFSFSFSLDSVADNEQIVLEESFNFGDINNDGFIDVILTEDSEDEELQNIYVVFGDREGFEDNIDLTALDGSNGFVIENTNGLLISFANFLGLDGDIFDFNGDENNDLIVDSFDRDSDTTYVLFGSEGDFPATIDLLDPETNAVAISRPDSEIGGIADVLDINNDGFDDLTFFLSDNLVDNPTTSTTVVFGSDSFSTGDGMPDPEPEPEPEPNDDNLVYRFFRPDIGVHFYTAKERERDAVEELPNFNFEGASYTAADPLTGNPEPVPVYRFLNEDTGVHLYTVRERERNAVEELPNYTFEGEAFFAYQDEVENSIPIYRFYNPVIDAHFYTPSERERDNVLDTLSDYQLEGIAYYAFPLDNDESAIE